MTDPNHAEHFEQAKAQVVEQAVRQARDPWLKRLGVAAIAVGILSLVGISYTLWTQHARIDSLQAASDANASQAQQLSSDGQKLAQQVRNMGGTPVVQPPPVGPSGPAGPAGQPGVAGRGITGTQLVAGHLVVIYTDGASTDVGLVAGQPGVPGQAGPQGRSITASTLSGGHLVLSYSDGSSADVGSVVGPAGVPGADGKPGRSVSSVGIDSRNHLIVTYSDGSSSDAGPLPAGPRGEAGPAGPGGPPGPSGPAGPSGSPGASGARGAPPAGWTWTDEVGRKQSCTRSGGSDEAPQYSCTAQPPVATSGR